MKVGRWRKKEFSVGFSFRGLARYVIIHFFRNEIVPSSGTYLPTFLPNLGMR